MHFNNIDFLEDLIGVPNTHENAFVDIAGRQTNRQRGRMDEIATHGAGATAIALKFAMFQRAGQADLWDAYINNDPAMRRQQKAAMHERLFIGRMAFAMKPCWR